MARFEPAEHAAAMAGGGVLRVVGAEHRKSFFGVIDEITALEEEVAGLAQFLGVAFRDAMVQIGLSDRDRANAGKSVGGWRVFSRFRLPASHQARGHRENQERGSRKMAWARWMV